VSRFYEDHREVGSHFMLNFEEVGVEKRILPLVTIDRFVSMIISWETVVATILRNQTGEANDGEGAKVPL
jgi:hypothetical protein